IISERRYRGNEARHVVRQDSHLNFQQLDAALDDLRGDRRSGAAELLSRAAAVFARLRAARAGVADLANARQAVLKTAVALVRAQPDMAPLARMADAALVAASRAANAKDALSLAEAGGARLRRPRRPLGRTGRRARRRVDRRRQHPADAFAQLDRS